MLASDFMVRADQRRLNTQRTLDPTVQLKLGQHFTPSQAAKLIASIPRLPAHGTLKILDPGAGTGSLLAALFARIVAESPSLEVNIVALEIDTQVADSLRETMDELLQVATNAGVNLHTEVVEDDFIDPQRGCGSDFDVVIMNPPYQKIPAKSRYREVMARRGVQAPNLYAAFLAQGALALKPGGQMVAITPRSFTNGVYFEQFRSFFLDRMTLDHIHVFDSRSTVFSDSGVLQENIIVSSTREGTTDHVMLSASVGHEHDVRNRAVSYSDIVRPADRRRFIRIPVDNEDDKTVSMMLDLPTSLGELGLTVSTGRVVDFRSRDNLKPESTSGYPMVYPANVRGGAVDHPKAAGKPQWFNAVRDSDANLLVPNGHYVLVKRFSAKEERRRIVAGVWMPGVNGVHPVAFDNKLNYFHMAGSGLDAEVAVGLSLWLNSGYVDKYFRTFSGHTQVNATDLREMRYPSMDILRKLGTGRTAELPPQEEIDELVKLKIGWDESA